ncbi:MAG: hypothetical protein KAI47_07705 [Deltaproteobacteria bacterium]|nr:hypothetical protein [Deltaproteobacteria bacterium]
MVHASDALGRRTSTIALLSPGALCVAAQRGDAISVWSRAGVRLARLSSTTPLRFAFVCGALLGVFNGRLAVRRGPAYRRNIPLRLPRRGGPVLTTALCASGRIAAALYAADGGASDATAVSFFDARRGRQRGRVVWQRGRIFGARFSRDGHRVAIFGDVARRRARVDVYALEGMKPRHLFRWESALDKTAFSAALSPDGRRLIIGAGRRLVLLAVPQKRVLATRATGAVLSLFPSRLRRLVSRFPGAHQLVFSADGESVAVLHAFGVNGVALWRVETLTPKAWLPRPASRGIPRQLAFDAADHLWLVSAGGPGPVEIFVARQGHFVRAGALRF